MAPKNYKIVLAYDGTDFFGWQKNQDGPSIEESLEKALVILLKHPIALQAASRTDRGVHAEEQIVNFFTSHDCTGRRFLTSLNALLPKQISALSLTQVADNFHPTLDTKSKEYHYHVCTNVVYNPILQRYCWHYSNHLSLSYMQLAAKDLIGKNDFSSFTNRQEPKSNKTLCHLYSIDISILEEGFYLFSLKGDRFLYKMARNLVGTLVYVGAGKIAATDIPTLISKKNRAEIGMTAPASGLRLKRVTY